jgi:hypothetical protein
MAALSAEERAASQAIYEEYEPDPEEHQTNPIWIQYTPLQVVRKAFNQIKATLSSNAVRRAFHEDLRLQESGIRFYYNEPVTQDHPLAYRDMLGDVGGTQEDQNKLDRAIFNILVGGAIPVPEVPAPEMSVKQSELGDDIFAQDAFSQGQRVIRLGGDNRFIFDREGLEHTWRNKPFRFNPLIGVVPLAPGTQIEYGVLKILPDGGRRRRHTKKSKRRARKTRRSHK